MAGHSKWSQIKHKKAVVDAKRSKEFGRLAKTIAIESRLTHGDTSSPSLKTAIEKAKAANMPKENIERAVQKGMGGAGAILETILYELYGPGGTAILIETLTDNRNRTVQELKHLVAKLGYQLAEPGAAAWAFVKQDGEWIPASTIPLDTATYTELEVILETLEAYDDVEEVYTNAIAQHE